MKKYILILMVFLAYACQDIEDCLTDDSLDAVIIEFFDKESLGNKKVIFNTVASLDTIYSSITYESSDSSSIALLLNPSSSETAFFFTSDTSEHELVLSHEVQFSVFDDKCDPSISFFNLDTVQYTFDSLSIPATITNRQLGTNVEVYF